ncbi:MAG TPA: AI-2E family transporter [Anaerovoracaceae bacterium]|nr:AI-2E family transporter [Anaerovoracaceae bacterium]
MKELLANKYFKAGVTLFLAGGALILFYGLVNDFDEVAKGFQIVGNILQPFIIGLIMAYLLCPVYNFVVKWCYKFFKTKLKTGKKSLAVSRVLSTIFSLAFLIFVIGGFCWLVIPELIQSIIGIIDVLPARMDELTVWAQNTMDKNPEIMKTFEGLINRFVDSIQEWAETKFIPGAGNFVIGVSQGIWGTVMTTFNVLIGAIVCVYFLNSKEKFAAQIKKLILATCTPERAEGIFEFGRFTNKSFGGFINGKIIDSAIIGMICFIAMSIIQLPYPVLISFIVGITNIIPFFGPFIGAIPSIIIIFLVSPIQAVYFAIMVLVLQQVDGNIIGPKILGGTTGLASFWVMFAIIVGGGLFGFVGMILGVPVFAIFYYYFSKFLSRRLEKKNLACDTMEYATFVKYDIDKEDIL